MNCKESRLNARYRYFVFNQGHTYDIDCNVYLFNGAFSFHLILLITKWYARVGINTQQLMVQREEFNGKDLEIK